MFAYEDREVPWHGEGSGGSEGGEEEERVAVGWSLAGPDRESRYHWGGRGDGPHGTGPSPPEADQPQAEAAL